MSTQHQDTQRQQHTPEPWHVCDDDPLRIDTGDDHATPGLSIAKFFGSDSYPCIDDDDVEECDNEAMADATRVVACVNALAGIPDPAAFVAEAKKAIEQTAGSVKWYADWLASGQFNTGDHLPSTPEPESTAPAAPTIQESLTVAPAPHPSAAPAIGDGDEIQRLRAALEWYADAANWNGTLDLLDVAAGAPTGPAAWQDDGDRARAALVFAASPATKGGE